MISWVCVISPANSDFLLSFVALVHFVSVFALKSLSPFCPLCHAGDRLVQLERKVRALEQEKSLDTTEGTSTSLRRYLNRPSSAFDRFEVLDLLQALVRLARTRAHHKAEEYAAGLDEVRARWDSLNSSELQRLMLGLLGDPVRAKIAKEAASILKSATKVSGLIQARPIRPRPWSAQGRGSCYRCGRWGYYARTCRSSQALFPYGRARGAPSRGWCGNSR